MSISNTLSRHSGHLPRKLDRHLVFPMLRFFKSLFVALAAIVILFEEWLWDPLVRLTEQLNRLPLVRQVSGMIVRFSPRLALAIYIGPMILLLPFKVGGLWLVGHGHPLSGIATFLAAKIVGTALFAWLFNLTKPALLQIRWFARSHAIVRSISETAHSWIHQQAFYRWIRRAASGVRNRVRQLFHSHH